MTVADGTVTDLDAGFTATLAGGGSVSADRVVLATGMHYQRPDLPGVERVLGRRGVPLPLLPRLGAPRRPAGGAGRPGRGPPRAACCAQWSDDVVVLADDLTAEDRDALDAAGIPVDERPVAALEGEGARLNAVRFADGSELERDGVMVVAPLRPRDDLGPQLGCETTDTPIATGLLVTDDLQQTTRPGRVRRRRRGRHDAAGGAGHRGRLDGRRLDAPLARLPVTPRLHQRHPELAATLPHVSLGTSPTPVRRLEALEPAGTELWIKDDGAYGDGGWGGNKVRKLEWILPEAQRRGARTILTVGGLGTNWGLATALYGREHGIATALMLLDQPVDDHVLRPAGAARRPAAPRCTTRTPRPAPSPRCRVLMARHAGGGRPPYLQPAGGSSAVGALGYVEAAYEIADQVEAGELPAPSHVVTTVGSGGTAAGLALGLALAGIEATVVGIVVNDGLRLDTPALTRLAGRTGEAAGQARRRDRRPPGCACRAWTTGWGRATATPPRSRPAAIADAAASEALELDPVYTSKTMSAIRAMDLGPGPVLYIHTDGPR